LVRFHIFLQEKRRVTKKLVLSVALYDPDIISKEGGTVLDISTLSDIEDLSNFSKRNGARIRHGSPTFSSVTCGRPK
jgi:hypothetical protein